VFATLFQWKQVDVDLFCSPGAVQYNPVSRQQLEAVSPYRMEHQVGWDGLKFVSQKRLYAFPPTALLTRLISRVESLGLQTIIVGPAWEGAPWWPLVVNKDKLYLGTVKDCLAQGRGGCAHPFGPSFDPVGAAQQVLWAWSFNM
jgi:hypothetical protein